MIKTDLKRAIYSPGFIAAYTSTVLIVLVSVFLELYSFLGEAQIDLMYGQHAMLLQTALSSRTMLMATPIICALPYTAAFIDDHRSGLIKLAVPRCGKASYVKGKLAATALSGGLPLLAGILTAYFVTWLFVSPMELAPEEGMPQEGLLYPVVVKALLFMVCGGFWAMVGALLGSLTMNKYMAYASPFIFYYLLVILCERYITNLYVINPYEWLNAQQYWPGGDWGIMLLLLEFMIIAALIYALAMTRRLYDDA